MTLRYELKSAVARNPVPWWVNPYHLFLLHLLFTVNNSCFRCYIFFRILLHFLRYLSTRNRYSFFCSYAVISASQVSFVFICPFVLYLFYSMNSCVFLLLFFVILAFSSLICHLNFLLTDPFRTHFWLIFVWFLPLVSLYLFLLQSISFLHLHYDLLPDLFGYIHMLFMDPLILLMLWLASTFLSSSVSQSQRLSVHIGSMTVSMSIPNSKFLFRNLFSNLSLSRI